MNMVASGYLDIGVISIETRENWNSRSGFILSSIGSAVGLGNIWRFPAVVAQNGGGAFLLVYLLAMLIVGLPGLVAEIVLGRKAQKDVVSTFSELKPDAPGWSGVGLLSVLASYAVLSFYAVVSGWILIYLLGSLTGRLISSNAQILESNYNSIIGNPSLTLAGQTLFLLITVLIVAKGVSKGIEALNAIIMPGIIVILILLFVRTMMLPGAMEGLRWFFKPNFYDLSPGAFLDALGQVFFSLSLGMGAILTYGSYVDKRTNIPQSATIIAGADLGVALLAGMIIVPTLFVFKMPVEAGTGLVFMALPAAFSVLPLGFIWASLFFIMLFFAALSSAVSILETGVAFLVDGRGWPRKKASYVTGLLVFALSIPSGLAENLLKGVKILGFNFLGFVDFLSSNIMLTLSGLFTAVFVGWVWGTRAALSELEESGPFRLGSIWAFAIKILAPLAISYTFISGLK